MQELILYEKDPMLTLDVSNQDIAGKLTIKVYKYFDIQTPSRNFGELKCDNVDIDWEVYGADW